MNPKKFVRKVLPAGSVKAAEETYRKSRIRAMQTRYGYPARDLQVIAITGTNGKTTTCTLMNAMLKSAGYKTAMFTTASVEVAGEYEPNTRHTTVPKTADLLQFLQRAKNAEVDYVVLEVTSHALHQHKVLNIPIEVAVMTNISQDHLDYHGSMEEYVAMKARLFNNYLQPMYCVLNSDDAKYNYFAKQSVGLVTSYGVKRNAEVVLSAVETDVSGTQFTLKINGKKAQVNLNLIGDFNAYNAAAAAGAGAVLGLSAAQISKGLASLDKVPGRMQVVDTKTNYNVIVDYAVTSDALEKSLQTLRTLTNNRILLVFGATGDRDTDKRPKMGKVAAAYADKIFLTDDETYTEDPAQIRKQVLAGIKEAKGVKKTKEIGDRKKAIAAALREAKKGDIVLCTGIGHQDARNMGGKLVTWDEVGVIKKALKKKH